MEERDNDPFAGLADDLDLFFKSGGKVPESNPEPVLSEEDANKLKSDFVENLSTRIFPENNIDKRVQAQRLHDNYSDWREEALRWSLLSSEDTSVLSEVTLEEVARISEEKKRAAIREKLEHASEGISAEQRYGWPVEFWAKVQEIAQAASEIKDL